MFFIYFLQINPLNIKFPCVSVKSQVVMNVSGYSLAVDIWSLGCTILEMATSKPPWSQYEGVRYWIFKPYLTEVIFFKISCGILLTKPCYCF